MTNEANEAKPRLAGATHMTCCCCGEYAGRWLQHWNRDTGYGVCMSCIRWMRESGSYRPEELKSLYGIEGVNYGDAHSVAPNREEKE